MHEGIGGKFPTLGEIATSVLLGDGESTVVTWNPSAEVEVSQGTFGEQYTFFCLDDNGEPCRVKGGSRLLSAWKKASADAPKGAKQLNGDRAGDCGTRYAREALRQNRKNRPDPGSSLASRLGAKPEPSNAIGR